MKVEVPQTKKNTFQEIFKDCDCLELVDVVTGEKIKRSAKLALKWNESFIYILFDVDDDHIWGTFKTDDDPVWQEEAVEVFLAFGAGTPKEYFELQFSPKGVKYDAWVKNPTGSRHDDSFMVDIAWDFLDLEYEQAIDAAGDPAKGSWKTYIKIPAKEIKGGNFQKGDILRGNFFRIDGYPKQNSFQALVPTFEKTPNFHTPEKFATFELI